MIDGILSLLGLCHKAGKIEIGDEPVGGAARAKKARVIFVAQDAAPASQRRAKSFAEVGSCLILPFPADKDAMGRALGRSSVAMCAVTDIGFAGAIVEKLAAMDEKYKAPSEALAVKAKRAAERRQEQLRHEKNIKTGKYHRHEVAAVAEIKESQVTEESRVSPKAPERKPYSKKPVRSYKSKPKETPRSRFEGSLPVKKGKGSKKVSSRTKVRSDH